jgi:hypothetical protein
MAQKINLSVELTAKLIGFAAAELVMIEECADEMYAPNGPVYWSREDTQGLLGLLNAEDAKVYGENFGPVLILATDQKGIMHTLVEVYAQEELGWTDTDCEITLTALAS